jgi:general stress protein 26
LRLSAFRRAVFCRLRAVHAMQQDAAMGTHNEKKTSSDQRAHVHAMLEELSDVMLTTFEKVGEQPIARARPMHITHLDQDDSIWIMTSVEGEAVHELEATKSCSVIAQSASRYVSLVGTGSIVTDKTRIRAMWKKMHEVWFPKGPDDPNVCLVHFTPTEAEFWDVSSMKGLKYLYEAAKALITHTTPSTDGDQHGTVKM